MADFLILAHIVFFLRESVKYCILMKLVIYTPKKTATPSVTYRLYIMTALYFKVHTSL